MDQGTSCQSGLILFKMQIITLQRTGSHFLISLISACFKIHNIKKYHTVDRAEGTVISIARDPLDSMTSDVSMNFYYNGWDDSIFESIVDTYVSVGSSICDRADVIVRYDDLVNDPLKVIDILSKKLNLPIESNEYVTDYFKDNEDNKYLKTSTRYSEYDKVRGILSEMDLSEAYKVYDRFLLKSSDMV